MGKPGAIGFAAIRLLSTRRPFQSDIVKGYFESVNMRADLDAINIHRPTDYQAQGYPWSAWDLLREQAPVYWYERDDVEPFWAVTRYDDVMTVSDHPDIFINGGPRLRLKLKDEPEIGRAGVDSFGSDHNWDPDEPPDMVFMDNPRHRHVRKLSSWAYTQGAMRAMRPRFEALAETFTDEYMAALDSPAARDEGLDVVNGLACKLPLVAVGEIMGLAPDDWKQILVWSKASIGEIDDDNRRPGESAGAAGYRNLYEFRSYLAELIRESRANGAERGGLIDRMVHHKVQGKTLTDQQLNGYLLLLIAAGNDTTRNALAGGIEAFIQHPEQLARLRDDLSLLPQAVEEVLRWTSPVGSFLRTAVEDFTLAGTRIRAGDTVGMFYPSANRDERVFTNPYSFDIARSPNPHLTFGFGAHFCLGTNLARAELLASLKALLPHLDRLELCGQATRIKQTHVLGYSILPLRLKQN